MWRIVALGCCALWFASAQDLYNQISNDLYLDQLKCPQHWVQFQQSCYRFIKSPLKPYNEAKRICQVKRKLIVGFCLKVFFRHILQKQEVRTSCQLELWMSTAL